MSVESCAGAREEIRKLLAKLSSDRTGPTVAAEIQVARKEETGSKAGIKKGGISAGEITARGPGTVARSLWLGRSTETYGGGKGRRELVEQRVKAFITYAQAKNTRAAYASGVRGFVKYMDNNNLAWESVEAVDIADYLISRVMDEGRAASTINGDKAAIADRLRHTKRQDVMEDPVIARVMGLLKKVGTQSKPKQHLAAELMKDILKAHDQRMAKEDPELTTKKRFVETRNITLMLIMMMGMLRESEAIALNVGDMVVQTELAMMGKPAIRTLQMGIVQSKTDQAKNGAVVLLCENAEKPEHCPVDRWEEYLKVKEAAGIVSEVAFPTEKGARMSASTPCHIVQKAVERANERYEESARAEGRDEPEKWGVPSAYGSHSLRRGGVTQARQNNMAMVDIQRHGRWKSLTVFAYVGLSAEEQRGVTRNFLAGATNGSSESSRTPKDSVPSRMASQLEAGGQQQWREKTRR